MASDDLIPQNPGWAQKPILCRTDSSEKDHVKVVLKGMCAESKLDTEFVLNWIPLNNNPWDQVSFYYQGRRNSSIIYKGDNKWEITDKQHFLFKEDDKLSKIDNFLFFLILDLFKRNWERNVPSKCKINWNGTA